MSEFDVIVIGLGGVGSFALRALACEHNKKVLGLERFSRGHALGSSHGGSRIYRHAYFEEARYVPLTRYAAKEFEKLQTSSGTKLLEECGTLIVEKENGPVIAASIASATQHGIQIENMSNSALKKRYPHFAFDDEMVGLLETNSGFVRPERAIVAALEDAEQHGATVWEHTAVQSFREVKNDDGSVHAEVVVKKANQEESVVVKGTSLVVAAGAWTSTLLPSWAPYLRVTRQIQAWIDVSSTSDPKLYHPGRMPTWLLASPDTPCPLYGIPADPDSDNQFWIKVALHGREDPFNPDGSGSKVTDAEMKELQEAAQLFVKDSSTLSWPSAKSCMYTMTPDEHFLVGRPSGYQCTFAAAGLSGHGFKMTPALGKILADLVTTGSSSLEAEFVSPSRFEI